MSIKTDIVTIAARLLGLRFNDALRNSRPLPAEAAAYFWDPARADGSVIVGADGTYLVAEPFMSWDQHLEEFTSGGRSRPEDPRLAAA